MARKKQKPIDKNPSSWIIENRNNIMQELKERIIQNQFAHPIDRLESIMEILRSENGCPWDKKQNHKTLIPCLLEEAYEVVDAIEKENSVELEEELGDLLFQSVFHSQLAKEKGEFQLRDVIQGISEKLIRRHPHVFLDQSGVDSPEKVVLQWEKIKEEEKKAKRAKEIQKGKEGTQAQEDKSSDNQQTSVLDTVPGALPAIQKADKIQSRVAKLGFDWENWQEPIQKLWEEVEELKQELDQLGGNQKNEEKLNKSLIPSDLKSRIESEMGDVIFSLINVGRHIGIDMETALRKTNDKFSSRFRYMETASRELGRSLQDMTLAEMDEIWNQAKDRENVK